jgi:serine/threonine protein kinase/tetratricopeptide (TPR) repeat protein
MTNQWDIMWDIFHAAVELPEAERAAYLREACKDDAELLAEVESLLASHKESDRLPAADAFLADLPIDEELAVASAGQQVGAYRIVREIGQGGMGVVYEAEQEQLNRRVALKLIRLGMDTQQVVARFEAERQALAMMNHPNIAQVIDAGATEAGRPYFVMEFIDGEPITDYCDKQRLSTAERLDLFLAVCAGVQHAHQKGIIHRDLKPTNVLVTHKDGKAVPKIIDFGVAKATAQRMTEKSLFTQAGILIGTPEYMSPEQADLSDLDVDTRTDVYSLGVLLFELLVGALPFEPTELRRAGYDEIRRRIREDEPARPSARLSTLHGKANELAEKRRTDSPSLIRLLRGDLDWITMRALEKAPDRRYASPSELAADLRRHMSDEPVEAGPPSTVYQIGKFARRHKVFVVAGSVVLFSLLLGVTAATFGLLRAQEAERLARAEARTSEEVSNFLAGLFRVSEPSAIDVNSITARDVLDRGVERIRGELSGEPEVQSRLMLEMGKVYAQLGLLQEADRLHEEALDIRRRLSSSTSNQIAEALAGLAGVRHLAGQHEASIELYNEAIQLAEAAGNDRDVLRLATVYRSLGGVYDTLARNADATATLQKARDMLETSGNTMTAEYGRVLRNIGMSHWTAGDFAAARPDYEESLRVYDQVLDPGHPEISYVVNSLAILNYNLGDFDAARWMFERELANLERTLGREHRNTASIMNNLGLLLLEMGLLDEARTRIEESLQIREAVLGPDHDEVATSLFNLAQLQVAEQNPQAARLSLERCLAIREVTLGPSHPYTVGTLDRYAAVLHQLGETDTALEIERRISAARQTSN